MSVIGFDCSGYFYHVMRESGYGIGRASAASYLKSGNFTDVYYDDVKPGDMINFVNHIGIVIEYNPVTGKGDFVHMSGGSPPNHGRLRTSPFTTGKDKKYITYYSITRPIKAFRRVKEENYKPELDFHKDCKNSNPVLQPIPENLKKHADLVAKLALNPNYVADDSKRKLNLGMMHYELRAKQATQYKGARFGVGAKRSILQRGDNGPAVYILQLKLNHACVLPRLTTDSRFGGETERALKNFQLKNGLRPNGRVDKETEDALSALRISIPTYIDLMMSKAHGIIGY